MAKKSTKATKASAPLWTLEQGLAVVRQVQPETRPFGYHLTLGGGVLNAGQSDKDIDLFFLPLCDMDDDEDTDGLVDYLTGLWGEGEPITREYTKLKTRFKFKLKFVHEGQRYDVFIL